MTTNIEIAVLKIIQHFNKGNPVDFQTIDRMLLFEHPEFVRSAQLGNLLEKMEADQLIYAGSERGGYLLTEKGKVQLQSS